MKKSLLIAALLATGYAFVRSTQSRPNNDGISNSNDDSSKLTYNGKAFVHAAPVQIM